MQFACDSILLVCVCLCGVLTFGTRFGCSVLTAERVLFSCVWDKDLRLRIKVFGATTWGNLRLLLVVWF